LVAGALTVNGPARRCGGSGRRRLSNPGGTFADVRDPRTPWHNARAGAGFQFAVV